MQHASPSGSCAQRSTSDSKGVGFRQASCCLATPAGIELSSAVYIADSADSAAVGSALGGANGAVELTASRLPSLGARVYMASGLFWLPVSECIYQTPGRRA